MSVTKYKLSLLNLRASLMCVKGRRSLTKHSGSQVVMTLKLHLTMHWVEESYGKGFRIRPGIWKNTKEHSEVVCLFCFVLYHFSYLDIHLTLIYFHSFCLWFVFYIMIFVGCDFAFWLLIPTNDCLTSLL